jgi:hypothetical protein
MKRFAKKLKWAYTILLSYGFKVDGRMSAEKFSRDRKLGFAQTCFVILRGSKRSLQAAIYTFLHESKSELDNYSKQAFSRRRQFIKPEAFLTLFHGITDDFYADPSMSPKSFRNLHVFAVDGTTYNLPNTPELKEIYGVQASQGEPQTQAKGSCLYDVLNNLLIDVKMLPIRSSEREIAVEHLNYLHGIKPDNNLVLLDRGYPSMELIHFFDENHLFYLMRCNKYEFISELRNLTETDKVLEVEKQLRKTKEKIQTSMRVIQFSLDNGTVETLITNQLDSNFTVEDFKYLYHLRWGIEEKYDELKNKLKIEAFSGATPVAVLQDFYATMFLTNLVAYAEMDCEEELALANQSRERKYEYRINRTLAIASVKDSFIELAMEQNPLKKKHALYRLSKRLLANLIPVRPGRSNERRRKHTALKFPNNRSVI